MKVGQYFSLGELTVSREAERQGLKNDPTPAQIESLRLLCKHILDPLRAHYGVAVHVSSAFRSDKVNKAINGAANSQHKNGEAADFTVPGHSVADVVATIRRLKLPFDQVIDEYSQWIHVSYGPRHRRQPLKARRTAGKTTYSALA